MHDKNLLQTLYSFHRYTKHFKGNIIAHFRKLSIGSNEFSTNVHLISWFMKYHWFESQRFVKQRGYVYLAFQKEFSHSMSYNRACIFYQRKNLFDISNGSSIDFDRTTCNKRRINKIVARSPLLENQDFVYISNLVMGHLQNPST